MMKNKMYAGALLCALAMMASCSNEEAVTGNVRPQGFSLKAEMGTAQTRTTVTEDYKVNWSTGDKIYIYGTDVYATFPLTAGSGSTTGTFAGTLKGNGGIEDLQYALYPAPKRYPVTDGNYVITLPAAYTYGAPSNSPMYAVFEEDKGNITFKHLCAMIRLTIKGIPSEGVKTLTVSSEDRNIAGDAAVTETSGVFSLAAPTAEGKTVSISIPDGTPAAADATDGLTFDIPLPAGDYTNGLKLQIAKEGSDALVAEKTVDNLSLEAGEILVMDKLSIVSHSINGETSAFVEKYVSSAKDLQEALNDENVKVIALSEDLTLSSSLSVTADKVIDLGENSVTMTNAAFIVASNSTLELKNGEISANNRISNVNKSGTLILDNVTTPETNVQMLYGVYANAGEDGASEGSGEDATVIVKDCKIYAKYYPIATNASVATSTYKPLTITIENSTLIGETGLFINVPSNVTVTDSEITGGLQGLLVRGGTVTCTNTTITKDAQYTNDDKIYEEWGTGNAVRAAAITLGNKDSNSYQYPTSLTLTNCTVSVTNHTDDKAPAVYAYANQGEGKGVTFTYDASCTFTPNTLTYASQNITVNGEAQNTEAD